MFKNKLFRSLSTAFIAVIVSVTSVSAGVAFAVVGDESPSTQAQQTSFQAPSIETLAITYPTAWSSYTTNGTIAGKAGEALTYVAILGSLVGLGFAAGLANSIAGLIIAKSPYNVWYKSVTRYRLLDTLTQERQTTTYFYSNSGRTNLITSYKGPTTKIYLGRR